MKHTFRSLAKSPGFTAIALLTLALGIGVNTATFGLVDAFLLSPAPYPQADRLVRVYRTSAQSKTWPHSEPDLRDLRQGSRALATLAPFQWWTFSLAEPGQPPERLRGIVASAEFFTVLGVQPVLGRAFTAEETQPGRDQVVVLTDSIWRARFGADPAVIGRTLRVDGASLTVIGVMPPAFAYPLLWGKLEAIRPLVISADWQHERGTHWLGAIARLPAGVSLRQAQTEADTVAARLAQQFPDSNAGTGLRLLPLHESAMMDTGRSVTWMVFGLAGFVLLIACANLANLQLARSAARAREFAIRAAVGASRTALMRQLLGESLVLSLAGGTFGVLIAVWLNDFLGRQFDFTSSSGAVTAIPLNWTVLGFALLASIIAGILSGFVPAWFASRTDVNTALKAQSRGATGDRSRHRFRQGLIAAELAFALVLLTGATFFIRGLQRFADRDPGWHSDGLITGTITLPNSLPTDRYFDVQKRLALYDRLLERLAALPGADHVALSNFLPIWSYGSSRNIAIEGRPDPAAGQEPLVSDVVVTPDFFATLGLQLVEGRTFPASIRADSPRDVVINETMAREFWPNESALGKRIGSPDPKQRNWAEVIGVVRDVGFVANFGLPETRLQSYVSLVQEPWGYLQIAVRSRNPQLLAEPIRRAVAALDPDLPVADLRTVPQAVDQSQRNFYVANQALGGFAVLGLALAALGLYGVISNLVAQRTSEFGIRVALGATPGQLRQLVLNQGLRLAAWGCAAGLLGSFALARILAAALPGLPGQDYFALAGNIGLLLFVALVACWLPARRATRVDPIVALRSE